MTDHDRHLFARHTMDPHPREVTVSIRAHAADIADRFNARIGTSDHDLMAVAWLLFSAAMEQVESGGTIQFVGGRGDGMTVDVVAIAENFMEQMRRTGEIRTDLGR